MQSRGSDYALQYTLDVPVAGLANNFIEKQAIPLQVDDWEMGTTHWAVKNADLYKMLFEKLRPYELRSSVLDLSNLHEVDPQLVSVMMPFATEFDDVYRTLGMAATENKMECNRADDFWEHPQIMQDVVILLKQSTIGCGWRS